MSWSSDVTDAMVEWRGRVQVPDVQQWVSRGIECVQAVDGGGMRLNAGTPGGVRRNRARDI